MYFIDVIPCFKGHKLITPFERYIKRSSKAIKKREKDKILNYREILEFSTYDEIIFHMAYKQFL